MRDVLLAVCAVVGVGSMSVTGADVMGPLAERYVRLVLAAGQHDPDFVDAYYGPPEWKPDPAKAPGTPADLQRVADLLIRDLAATAVPDAPLERLRRDYLIAQTGAAGTRLALRGGARMTFDEESQALYDAVAPTHDEAYFAAALKTLDGLVPGDGALASRVEAFRQRFVIPPGKLDVVFRTAVDACRQQTAAHLALPAGEQFTIEYVTGKPWSGYNWYQGNYRSVIQVNTDLPTFIDRALDLACHEGYPGHHVVQRAARTPARARPGLAGVHRLSVVLPAVAHRRGHGELRHRRGLSRCRPRRVRARAPVPACRSGPGGGAEVLRGACGPGPAGLRGQRGGAAIPRRPNHGLAGRRLPRDLHAEFPPTRRATRALLRPVPQLRHQLQPGQGPRTGLCGTDGRKRRQARGTMEGVWRAAVVAARCRRGCEAPIPQSRRREGTKARRILSTVYDTNRDCAHACNRPWPHDTRGAEEGRASATETRRRRQANQHAAPRRPDGDLRDARGHMDVRRRLARRTAARVRSARRSLYAATRGRDGHGDQPWAGLRPSPAVLSRWHVHRFHFRRRRDGEPLDRQERRHESPSGDGREDRVRPQRRLAARWRVPRRPPRRGQAGRAAAQRAVAVPPAGRQRREAHRRQRPQRGHRSSGLP